MDDITIERAVRGNRDAQASLLRSMQDVWFRFCLSQLRDEHAARDATQETALRVLRELPRFARRSRFETWSIGIALNVCREQRRVRRASGSESIEIETEPINEIDLDDDRRALRDVLDRLPERQREAVVLRYFEDLSVEETAAAMGVAQGTVKATIFQALRSLKASLTSGDRKETP